MLPFNIIESSNLILMHFFTFYYFIGAFVPLTMEGKIVVDGVLASSYSSIDHDVAHLGMTPLQWIPEIVVWVFGNDKNIPGFVMIANDLSRGVLPYGIMY